MPTEGFLLISDISGFSSYLHESELDHARDSLSDLLNLLVENTRSPLRIVELEGDAIFSHALAEEITEARQLTEMVEDAYVAFRRALDLMIVNTTCTCEACRLLPSLDLKFLIHFGTYVRQQVADHAKLIGNDVNLIHRLLKNSIQESLGLEAYAAYTQPAVSQLQLDESVEGLRSHLERSSDVGEIELCVKDMHGVWERRRDHVRLRVAPESAIRQEEFLFGVDPERLWSYVTEPATRNLLMQSDYQRLETLPDGGTGPGATFVCAHGTEEILQTIVDWDPPTSYTVRNNLPLPGVVALATCEVEPAPEGSRLRIMLSVAKAPLPIRWLLPAMMGLRAEPNFDPGVQALRQRIIQERTDRP